jgi:hypothetical protein
MDAQLCDSTGSMELVQNRDGTERLDEGFLEANWLVEMVHELMMSAKQLKRGRLSCLADIISS